FSSRKSGMGSPLIRPGSCRGHWHRRANRSIPAGPFPGVTSSSSTSLSVVMRRLLTLSLLTLLAVPAIARATSAGVDVSSVQPRITNLHSTTSTVSGGETEMAAWSESDHTGIAWRSLTGRWTPARALPPGLVDIGDYSDDAFMAVFQNGTQIKAM